MFAFVFKSINRNLNQWHLYDDDDVFPNVVEGTGLAKYARMLLYEYVSKEDYESFVNSTETVVKKWDCFVAKAHKIAELMYFLQKSENDFLGGFTKFKQNIREAIEVEYLNKKDHPQFFSNETGEINTYGHNAAHALTEACLDGYKEDGVWKGFLEEASEKFFGIVKQACVRAGSFPVEKSDWVDFFSEKVYPDLLKDVFSKEHEEQNKYIQFDVILEILEKAQQTEKEFVIEQGGGVVDMETNKTEITEEGMIGSDTNTLEATAIHNDSEKDYFAIFATAITMSSIPASENTPPSQLVPTNVPGSEEEVALETKTTGKNNRLVGSTESGRESDSTFREKTTGDIAIKPLTLPGKMTEPTKEQTNENNSQKETVDSAGAGRSKSGSVDGNAAVLEKIRNDLGVDFEVIGQPIEPTEAPLEETQAQEEEKEDGSKLVLEILKRQLSCVIDNRYKSVEEYVPKAILTLTPEEVKVIDAKKDFAAEDAIKSVIERMKQDADEDDSEEDDGSVESYNSCKVSKCKYRYSEDEVKCWFDSLKKCHAYDLGFAADPGTDDKKCWCPCW